MGLTKTKQENICGTLYQNIYKCYHCFCRFYDKSRNQWADRKKFVKVPGKYDLVELDYSADNVSFLSQVKVGVFSHPFEQLWSVYALSKKSPMLP